MQIQSKDKQKSSLTNKNATNMTNKDIIRKAQEACGENVTGYRADITCDTLKVICEALWKRAANLTYDFFEWMGEVKTVIGVTAFRFFYDNILDFQHDKMNQFKYSCHHGRRYCEK